MEIMAITTFLDRPVDNTNADALDTCMIYHTDICSQVASHSDIIARVNFIDNAHTSDIGIPLHSGVTFLHMSHSQGYNRRRRSELYTQHMLSIPEYAIGVGPIRVCSKLYTVNTVHLLANKNIVNADIWYCLFAMVSTYSLHLYLH